MSKNEKVACEGKQLWEKPQLKRLGTMRDIAGPIGSGNQSGPNTRAGKS
ncbi:MAG: hypothetical protein ACM308_05970 [Qipengyuania vulgaris]